MTMHQSAWTWSPPHVRLHDDARANRAGELNGPTVHVMHVWHEWRAGSVAQAPEEPQASERYRQVPFDPARDPPGRSGSSSRARTGNPRQPPTAAPPRTTGPRRTSAPGETGLSDPGKEGEDRQDDRGTDEKACHPSRRQRTGIRACLLRDRHFLARLPMPRHVMTPLSIAPPRYGLALPPTQADGDRSGEEQEQEPREGDQKSEVARQQIHQ